MVWCMKIEIDMSGKIEQTHLDTVIGLSNDKKVSVVLPRKTKRKLEVLFRMSNTRRIYRYVVLAACIAILFELYLPRYKVIIDTEYLGHEVLIKNLIKTFLSRMQIKQYVHIEFSFIGKHSLAHLLCSEVASKKRKPTKTITEKELTELLFKKKIGNPFGD